MSERESFIARWSRRKRAATEDADAADASLLPAAAERTAGDPAQGTGPAGCGRDVASEANSEARELPFDVAKLPSIEEITAKSDVRAFLDPRVPAELTRAALRRAWSADPEIRDFIGPSENSWDFNAPGSMAGFGPLEMTDELRRQIAQMVGRSVAAIEHRADGREGRAPVESTGEPDPVAVESCAQQPRSGIPQDESVNSEVASYSLSHIDQVYDATQHSPAQLNDDQMPAKRTHGRALPK
jgi:Protein of unknown function (DUF3306)